MVSTLVGSVRTVVKRLAADWLIAGAALTTILLATVLLASGPVYADAVTVSALRQTIDGTTVTQSNVAAQVSVFPDLYDRTDTAVRGTVEDIFSVTGADVFAQLEAESYGLTDRGSRDGTDLVSFQYFEAIESKTTLIEGRWPSSTGSRIEVAVNGSAADALELGVGDTFEVTNRRDGSLQVTALVTGVYEVADPADAFWFDDDLALGGRSETTTFRTFGPFVVTLESMLESLSPNRVQAEWRVLPDYGSMTVAHVDELGAGVAGLAGELDDSLSTAVGAGPSGSSGFIVTTGLPSLLSDVDRSLTVTRASVLALLIQLAILAGYALVLTAGLLVDARRAETVLLRSRGTSPRQIVSMSLLEGVILTAPAVLMGPTLAAVSLRALNTVGPLASIGLTIEPRPTPEAYLLASIAAGLSVIALTWPAWRSARVFGQASRRNRRQQSRSGTQRIGVDLALLALAVIVFWQLQELGPQLSGRIRGRFGLDPLLVIAPAIGLLTGAILALRVVPLLARLAEWMATSRNSLTAALASWQVARRPARYARSSLLLMMAIGIGFFAASYSTTWIASQSDQAGFAVGADLSVTPDRSGDAISDLQLSGAHTSIEGVAGSMPVQRISGRLSVGGTGQFMILDAAKAADIVAIRPDLAPDFAKLMDRLVAGRPTPASVHIPGEPTSLVLEFDAIEQVPEDPEELGQCGAEPMGSKTCFNARVRVIVQDGDGVLHRVDGGFIAVNEGPIRLEAALTFPTDRGPASPVYPLSVVNIEIRSQLPVNGSRAVNLGFGGLWAVAADGTQQRVPVKMDEKTWEVAVTRVIGAQTAPSIAIDSGGSDGLGITVETGAGFRVAPAYFSIRPKGTSLPETFPIVVSRTFPATASTDVGEQVRLPPLRLPDATGQVMGTIEAFPTVDAARGETIVVDLPTYQILGYEPGYWRLEPHAYWLDTNSEDSDIAATLLTSPFDSLEVAGRQELIRTSTSDPVALGTIGALTVGFVAAAVFAAVGFAVSATVSARERLVEFALLRALGLSSRQLGSWLIIEQGVLTVVSLAMGTLIGLVLTGAILPLVTLTQDGQPAVPEVIVMYPWETIILLELVVVATLALIVAAMYFLLQRIGLGSLLRMGEE